MQLGDTVRRRTVLGGIASVGAATVGGAALLTAGSEPAQAQISSESFDVTGANHSSMAGTVEELKLQVSGNWSYTVGRVPDSCEFAILVGHSDNSYEPIVSTTETATSRSDSGTYNVIGRVIANSAWTQADFTAPDGQSITVDLPVRARLRVKTSDGTVLVEAHSDSTPTIGITDTGAATAQVGGSGTVEVVTPTA